MHGFVHTNRELGVYAIEMEFEIYSEFHMLLSTFNNEIQNNNLILDRSVLIRSFLYSILVLH